MALYLCDGEGRTLSGRPSLFGRCAEKGRGFEWLQAEATDDTREKWYIYDCFPGLGREYRGVYRATTSKEEAAIIMAIPKARVALLLKPE